ncbi:MAG: MOSC domain-containing protein [Gammaproteobacteria bacterium]|nr:MOSC domain-containing protein [Gammaproteobacteria bacterium]
MSAHPVTGLYAGPVDILEPDGRRSAIVKRPVARAFLGPLGLDGDAQADRRVHGGPDQALHQFAVRAYGEIVARFPALAGRAVPGTIGENLSCPDLAEDDVAIGDVYRLGAALVQVSQPRSPCWKIDHRYGTAGVAKAIVERHCPGWYLRVLEPGAVALGDAMTLVERPAGAVLLAEFLAVTAELRPPRAALAHLAACPGLSAAWRTRLGQRRDYRH